MVYYTIPNKINPLHMLSNMIILCLFKGYQNHKIVMLIINNKLNLPTNYLIHTEPFFLLYG